jgi:hypothetical protein
VTVLQNLAKNDGDELWRNSQTSPVSTTVLDEFGFTHGIDEGQTKRSLFGKKSLHNRSTASEQLEDRVIDVVNDPS